jgi:hypothetical protein
MLGLRPGKEMGTLLAEIRELQLADELATPEAAKAWVEKQSGRRKAESGK